MAFELGLGMWVAFGHSSIGEEGRGGIASLQLALSSLDAMTASPGQVSGQERALEPGCLGPSQL